MAGQHVPMAARRRPQSLLMSQANERDIETNAIVQRVMHRRAQQQLVKKKSDLVLASLKQATGRPAVERHLLAEAYYEQERAAYEDAYKAIAASPSHQYHEDLTASEDSGGTRILHRVITEPRQSHRIRLNSLSCEPWLPTHAEPVPGPTLTLRISDMVSEPQIS